MLVRNQDKDEWGILPLQNKILEIMMEIHDMCNRNSIRYVIAGGTLLGAVRHGGFIPWDDDLDIYMSVEQYEKFKECFNELQEKFVLQETVVHNKIIFAKVREKNTTYIEPLYKDNKDMHQGIYVDIFIIHKVSNHKFMQFIQYSFGKYITLCGLCERGYKKKGIVNFILKIIKFSPKFILKPLSLKFMYMYDHKDTSFYANLTDRLKFSNCIYPDSMYKNIALLDFETIQLYAPLQTHKILKIEFGDYMIPPPFEEIKRMQHAEIWDIHNDYKMYLK